VREGSAQHTRIGPRPGPIPSDTQAQVTRALDMIPDWINRRAVTHSFLPRTVHYRACWYNHSSRLARAGLEGAAWGGFFELSLKVELGFKITNTPRICTSKTRKHLICNFFVVMTQTTAQTITAGITGAGLLATRLHRRAGWAEARATRGGSAQRSLHRRPRDPNPSHHRRCSHRRHRLLPLGLSLGGDAHREHPRTKSSD